MSGKRANTTLTFSVTLPNVTGTNIPGMRNFIRNALIDAKRGTDSVPEFDMAGVKIHLTNKEVTYGKR